MSNAKFLIFVSSVQKETTGERRAVRDFIRQDPMLKRYFNVFLFEEMPAKDRRADEVYLDEVDRCSLYLGIFGEEYGSEDDAGVSPTEREFERATEKAKERLIFVKGDNDKTKQPKMRALVRKASRQLVRRRFNDTPDLIAQVYASLVQFLLDRRLLRNVPFDAAVCPDASIKDISSDKVRWFLDTARAERNFALTVSATPSATLTHLNLLHDGKPTQAAVLLFGRNPQHFLTTVEVKCLHFHGTEVRKPIPSYQVYRGTAFDLVDQAVDFVLAKLNRTVEPGQDTPASTTQYEIPQWVVREAIVNAVAHRDYTSNAAVQVMLFADRLEVWNPGALPSDLTLDMLRTEHPSIPRNPLVCEPMFLAHYVEKAGTGTLDMIALCKQAGLPEPDFEQRGGQFVTTVWRDWLTPESFSELALNERQIKAMALARRERRLTNATYQQATGASRPTTKRDLEDLVKKGVLLPRGAGRGAYYELPRKRPINGSNGSFGGASGNGS
jgi:ATP-dependent DNA helicase RecG